MSINDEDSRSISHTENEKLLVVLDSDCLAVKPEHACNGNGEIFHRYNSDLSSDEPSIVVSEAFPNNEDLRHLDQSVVPPLDLLSGESSVLDSSDPLKGTLDIDLRSQSESDAVVKASLNSSCDVEQSISARWDQFSAELRKLQKCDVKPVPKSLSRPTIKSCPTRTMADVLMVGDEILGRVLKGTPGQAPKVDFVTANKRLASTQPRKTFGSYEVIHRIQGTCKSNASSTPCSKSAPAQTRLTLPNIMHRNLAWSAPVLSTQTPGVLAPSFPRQSDGRHGVSPTRDERRTSDGHIPLDPIFTNGTPPSPLTAGRQRYTRMFQPATSSGVFRMGLLQQSELIRAHRAFFNNLCPTLPDRRGELVNSQPIVQTPILMSPNPNSCLWITQKCSEPLVQLPRGKNLRGSHNTLSSPVTRYTATDYRLLSRIQPTSGTLGPDLNSDEYKQRWAKYQRQRGYAELLRQHAQKQRVLRTCNPLRPGIQCDASDATPIENASVSSLRELKRSQTKQAVVEMSIEDKKDHEHKIGTPIKESASSRDNGPTNEAESTDKERYRRIAARKREAMLEYAKRVNKKKHKQKKLEGDKSKPTHCAIRSKGEPAKSSPYMSDSDVDICKQVQRHEDDQRRAKSIAKLLKVEQ